jgi:hypothetical protein
MEGFKKQYSCTNDIQCNWELILFLPLWIPVLLCSRAVKLGFSYIWLPNTSKIYHRFVIPTSLSAYVTQTKISFPGLRWLPNTCLIRTSQQKYLYSSVTIHDSFPSSYPFPSFLQISFPPHFMAFTPSHLWGDTMTHFIKGLVIELDNRRLSQRSSCIFEQGLHIFHFAHH